MKTARAMNEVRVCQNKTCRAQFRRKRYASGKMEELDHFRRRRYCDKRCKGQAMRKKGRPRACRQCRGPIVRRVRQVSATRVRMEVRKAWMRRRFCSVRCRREWFAADPARNPRGRRLGRLVSQGMARSAKFAAYTARRRAAMKAAAPKKRATQQVTTRRKVGRPATRVCFHGRTRGEECVFCERLITSGLDLPEWTRWRHPLQWARLAPKSANRFRRLAA